MWAIQGTGMLQLLKVGELEHGLQEQQKPTSAFSKLWQRWLRQLGLVEAQHQVWTN